MGKLCLTEFQRRWVRGGSEVHLCFLTFGRPVPARLGCRPSNGRHGTERALLRLSAQATTARPVTNVASEAGRARARAAGASCPDAARDGGKIHLSNTGREGPWLPSAPAEVPGASGRAAGGARQAERRAGGAREAP